MSMPHRSLLFFAAFFLLLAVLLQAVIPNLPQPPPRVTQPLDALIPRELPGWTCTDVPLAETEELRARVGEILSFDDHISRLYRRGDTEILLYVAYWKPGQVPVKQVHEHTPDICWVRNGWQPLIRAHHVQVSSALLPCEERTFSQKGQLAYVRFWHIVGQDVYSNPDSAYGQISLNFLKSLTQFGLNQRQEQLFVRISSNQPLPTIATGQAEDPLAPLLHLLAAAALPPSV